ncbi:MAG: hypothetical protein AAFY88_12575 [Acidobacteriota bacterium]
MPPVDPKKDAAQDGAPVFKSYFDLLEAKYAEQEDPSSAGEASAEPVVGEGAAEPDPSERVAAVVGAPEEGAAKAESSKKPRSPTPPVASEAAAPPAEPAVAEAKVAAGPTEARPRGASTARGPGGGRRKEGGQWLVTLLVLLTLGVGFIGAMRWISKDWWQEGAAESSP